MVRIITLFVILHSLLLAQTGQAAGLERLEQEGRLYLSLQDCKRMVVSRNFDIRLARESLNRAEADIAKARAALLPSLQLEASYSRFDEELGFSFGPQSFIFMDEDIYKAGLIVRHPLYTGGRLQAAHQAARFIRDAQVQSEEVVRNRIIFQVIRAYHTVQLAESFHKVAKEAVGMLQQHEHDVAILVEKGANPEFDLLRTRTELANARTKLNGTEKGVDLARSALKNLLDIDFSQTLVLLNRLELPSGQNDDLSTLTRHALVKRPELVASKAQMEAARQQIRAAKGEYLPAIALEGRYEYLEGDIRDMDGGDHWTIGVGAELPVWTWGEIAAKVRKAESLFSRINLEYEQIADFIRLEVRKAYLEIEKVEKNIEAAEAGRTAAREAYRLSRAMYRAGAGTNTEVLNARTGLSRAEADYTQALFDYNVAFADLERAVGTNAFPSGKAEEELL
jgi:outer membrane protein